MAKALSKKTTEYLRTDLEKNAHDLAEMFSPDQAKALAENASFLLQLVGAPIVAYHQTVLDEKQQAEYERLVQERESAKAKHESGEAENQIKLDHNLILKERFDSADPADYGAISIEVEEAKTKALLAYVADYESKLAELAERILPLANVKLYAALEKFDEFTQYSGGGARSNVGTRPDLPGNSWLVLDLFTRDKILKTARGQFYLDPACDLYFMPVGEDWHKPLGKPFELDLINGWAKLCRLPADKLTSATVLQGLAHDALKTVKTYESQAEWGSAMAGKLANDNIDTSSVGGSRSVWQVVKERSEKGKGYVREIPVSETEAYKLPEFKAEQEAEPKGEKKTAKK